MYSTQHGKMCPDCGRPVVGCVCRRVEDAARTGDGIVRVGRETQGRKGKGVTVVKGLTLGAAELAALCTELKRKCGSGGTVKGGVIEIQGDHRDALVAELGKRGWTTRRSGG